jgi:hypothetical protein
VPRSSIEQWDETGRLLKESHEWIEGPASVLAALLSDAAHTVTVEVEDDQRGSLLLAARDQQVLVGWTDPEYCNYQVVSDSHRDGQVEMLIGGVPTTLAAGDLVSIATAELAIQEFLGEGRGSLGLVWNPR